MKPSALRIERQLAKVEAELARSARPRRYCFYFDEEAEAKASLPESNKANVLSCSTSLYICNRSNGPEASPDNTAFEILPMPTCRGLTRRSRRPLAVSRTKKAMR